MESVENGRNGHKMVGLWVLHGGGRWRSRKWRAAAFDNAFQHRIRERKKRGERLPTTRPCSETLGPAGKSETSQQQAWGGCVAYEATGLSRNISALLAVKLSRPRAELNTARFANESADAVYSRPVAGPRLAPNARIGRRWFYTLGGAFAKQTSIGPSGASR